MPATDGEFGQSRVYRRQGATELTVASGGLVKLEPGGEIDGNTATGTFIFAPGEIESSDLSANLRLGYIDLPIHSARLNSTIEGQSVVPASGTVPNLLKVSTAVAKMNAALSWPAGNSGASAAVVWQVAVPPDFNSDTGFSIRFWGDKSSGNEDVDPVIGLRLGGTATADQGGSATTNFTTAQAEQVRNIASGIVSYPNTMTISFHTEVQASAVVRLYGGHVRYQRKT